MLGSSPSACSRRLGSAHGDRRRPRGRFHARTRSRAASRAEIYPANRSIIRYLMVFPSVCVCGGDLWWRARDAAAICIVNVVGQQQHHHQQQQQQQDHQHQQHQQQQQQPRNGVSILALDSPSASSCRTGSHVYHEIERRTRPARASTRAVSVIERPTPSRIRSDRARRDRARDGRPVVRVNVYMIRARTASSRWRRRVAHRSYPATGEL